MGKLNYLLLVLVVVVVGACSSGKVAYEKGDYYDAVIKSVNRLRSNPSNRKALYTIENAYPMAVQYYQDEIDQTLTLNQPFKWTKVVGYLERVNRMASEISRSPAAKSLVREVKQYGKELADARLKAAEEQYIAGMELLKEDDRMKAREACSYFERCQRFVPGFKDVKNRIAEAIDRGTVKVIVEPIVVRMKKYQISADYFYDELMAYLYRQHSKEKFLRFYSPDDAAASKVDYPDHLVQMEFRNLYIGRPRIHESVNDVASADSVKVGEVKLKDGSKLPVLGIVKARLHVFTMEVISEASLEVKVSDFQANKLLWRNQVPAEFLWVDQWGNFNGDVRALTAEEVILCEKKPLPPPNDQHMFVEISRILYDQTMEKLRNFYRRY
ncbi:hypothetical protein EYV94_01800 [Puteibacter caeruleilacunae]|nr:hypothetical protein EYV94_01800 [Puteibacter caeruleilacunae]